MPIVSKPLPLRRAERKNGPRIRRGQPPPHRHRTAIVETHNMKTLKLKNPLRPAATALLPLRVSGNVPLVIKSKKKAGISSLKRTNYSLWECICIYDLQVY